MEHLEVRSKSFLIKWITAPENCAIKWEVKPLKRSINFGIYKYKNDASNLNPPSTANSNTSSSPIATGTPQSLSRRGSTLESFTETDEPSAQLSIDEVNQVSHKRFTSMLANSNNPDSSENSLQNGNGSNGSNSLYLPRPSANNPRKRSDSALSTRSNAASSTNTDNMSLLEEKLDKHLVKEEWIGRCPGDELVSGTFQIDQNSGGLYAFVFDNTFSKTKGKKIMFNQYIEKYDDLDENAELHTINNEDEVVEVSSRSDVQTNRGGNPLDTIDEDAVSLNSTNASIDRVNDPQALLRIPSVAHSTVSLNRNNTANTTVTNNTSNAQLQRNMSRKSNDFHHPNNVKFEVPASEPTNNHDEGNKSSKKSKNKRRNSVAASTIVRVKGGQYLQGFLLKRKRRRASAKNFSKRFFVLNFKYGVLDYYFNANSNNIRGNMYIKNSVISADSKQMMIFLDSGIEQWVLKALNSQDFNTWVQAFNFIKKSTFSLNGELGGASTPVSTSDVPLPTVRPMLPMAKSIDNILDNEKASANRTSRKLTSDDEEDEENYIDDENSNVDGSFVSYERESRAQVMDNFKAVEQSIADIKALASSILDQHRLINEQQSSQVSLQDQQGIDVGKRRPSLFWKRGKKNSVITPSSSSSIAPSSTSTVERSSPAESPNLTDSTSFNAKSIPNSEVSTPALSPTNTTHNTVSSLEELNDKIKSLELEYSLLMNTTTNRGFSRPPLNSPRRALSRTTTIATSVVSHEFYDAQEYIDEINQGVVMVNSDDDEDDFHDAFSEKNIMYDESKAGRELPNRMDELLGGVNFGSSSDEEDNEDDESDEDEFNEDSPSTIKDNVQPVVSETEEDDLDLSPLPVGHKVNRRNDIPQSTVDPPSLIGFLRKNIGKDMSTIAMPVSSNEPLTFMQKYSEAFEYSNILNEVFESTTLSDCEKILKVAVFVVTSISSYRAKIRNTRKPFNPLLGETYELVRDDLGLRAIVEKVVHRPPVFAVHAETSDWIMDHNASPNQKYGGKSIEISISGLVKLRSRKDGTTYTWHQPITLLKNIIAGEKYTEPYSSVVINCSNGCKAEIAFKVVGMFSGRSETLTIKAFDAEGNQYKREITGSWVECLNYSDNGEVAWKVGKLVSNYQKKFGFTEFASSLNEITEIEDGYLAPTDSRLRPDQRAYEEGRVDEAETLKIKLEEEQRERRKINDGAHTPTFFKMAREGDNESWTYIKGEKSYWNRRKRHDWDGLLKLW